MKEHMPISHDCNASTSLVESSFFEHSTMTSFPKPTVEPAPHVEDRLSIDRLSRKRKFAEKESSSFFELFELLERLPLRASTEVARDSTSKQRNAERHIESHANESSARLTECFSLSKQIGTNHKQSALALENLNTVWKASFYSSGKIFAVKFLPAPSREHLCTQKRRHIRSEIEIHRKMKHPYIARLCGFIKNIPTIPLESVKACALVVEYSPFGSLHDQLFTNRVRFSETEVSRIIGQLCSALRYMHNMHHTVHCDVKLANILYNSGEKLIKLIDFGFAVDLQHTDQSTQRASDAFAEQQRLRRGTLNYLSPEQIAGTVEHRNLKKVDVWAVGMCAYELMCGTSAFENISENGTRQKILAGRFSFTELRHRASEASLSFISACFQIDPRRRPSIDALMKHPWLNQQALQDS